MGDDNNLLPTAALVVALVALVVSLGQVIGQYSATADGYRRCQASVMGPWARKTRLRWRWSQFRFETLFTVPEIMLSEQWSPSHDVINILDWTPSSTTAHPAFPGIQTVAECDELVCWVPFLQSLYQNEMALSMLSCYQTANVKLLTPAIRFRERSWDFVLPEIVRPLAVSNISDIAAMARRLGMVWTEFRPEEGIMRAEGNGHILSSTFSRSTGVTLRYMKIGESFSNHRLSAVSSPASLYVPTPEADMLGFGILAGCKTLSIPSLRMGTIGDVYASMNLLDKSHKSSQKIKDVRGIEPNCTFGFSDLIPLAAPMMRLRGSTVIRLPIPTEYWGGLTLHEEGFVVFHNRLKEYIQARNGLVSDRIKWVLNQYESLKSSFREWESEIEANEQGNERSLVFLEKIHTYWDETTQYFVKLEHSEKKLVYLDLVSSHITHAVNYWGDAWSNVRERKTRDRYGLDEWIAEGAHLYFDYLPSIAADMAQKGAPESIVDEAWMVMMFRAFCWWRCHHMSPVDNMIQDTLRIPSRYWRSRFPVYIG